MADPSYQATFCNDQTKRALAWDKAWEIRNFEIELYWKRATYFWAFQISILAAFGLSVRYFKEPELQPVIFLFANIGIIISFAWLFANKASKFWQQNWEGHIDLLEDELSGPLYKTLVKRDSKNSFSVSRINEHISMYFCVVWMLLAAGYLAYFELFNFNMKVAQLAIPECIIGIVTVIFLGSMARQRTDNTIGRYETESRPVSVDGQFIG